MGHAIASRGAWDRQGGWRPVPYVDTKDAERLFRHNELLELMKCEDDGHFTQMKEMVEGQRQ